MRFPTRQELEQIIADGKLCMSCNKNPAEVGLINASHSIVDCTECRDKKAEESKKHSTGGIHYNPERVYSVQSINGKDVPFNQGGHPINPVHAKYERKSWEKPRF